MSSQPSHHFYISWTAVFSFRRILADKQKSLHDREKNIQKREEALGEEHRALDEKRRCLATQTMRVVVDESGDV